MTAAARPASCVCLHLLFTSCADGGGAVVSFTLILQNKSENEHMRAFYFNDSDAERSEILVFCHCALAQLESKLQDVCLFFLLKRLFR